MFRTLIAATAALVFAAPAFAQDSDLLVGDAWECRAVSLIGEPTGELMLAFDEGGGAYVSFYMEIPVQDTLMAVEFDLGGEWSVDDATLAIQTSEFSMINAWMDGEEMDFDAVEKLGAELEKEFADYGGENEIAFISEHALVLEELETSISCWR